MCASSVATFPRYPLATWSGLDKGLASVDRILTTLAHHQFAVTVVMVGLILVLFLGWTAYYFARIVLIRRSIKKVLGKWQGLDPHQFLQSLGMIHQELSKHKILGHAWQEFRETFLLPDEDDPEEDQVVSNTIDAGAFFNEETILARAIDMDFVRSVPNILTGIGILGTFLGLVLGLYGARDLLEHPEHIDALFRGAYLAFGTSLAGLLCSILFSLAINPLVHGLSSTLGALVTFFDSRVRRLTVESLSRDLLKQARRHTRALETFSTDVAVAIGDRISENLDNRLVPVLEQLTKAVEKTLETERETITETLRKIVEDLHATTGEAVKKQIESLGRKLEEVGDRLDAVTDALGKRFQDAGEQFRGEMDEAAQNFSDVVTRALETLAGATEGLAAPIREATEALVGATVALEEKRKVLEETASALGPPLEALSRLLPELAEAAESLAGTGEKLDALPGQVRPLVESLVGTGEKVRETTGTLQEVLTGSRNAIAALDRAWQEHARRMAELAGRFEKVDNEIAAVFRQLADGLGDYRKNLAAFHNELDANVEKISGSLTAVTEELAEICGRIGGHED